MTELRLEGITTIEDANGFLPVFLERHNARFAVPAADPPAARRDCGSRTCSSGRARKRVGLACYAIDSDGHRGAARLPTGSHPSRKPRLSGQRLCHSRPHGTEGQTDPARRAESAPRLHPRPRCRRQPGPRRGGEDPRALDLPGQASPRPPHRRPGRSGPRQPGPATGQPDRGPAPGVASSSSRRQRMPGVNHAHLAELLAEREGLEIAERTLRRILAQASVRPTRTRRPPRHRSRRERMPREGMLLQVDGSRHRWFGPDLPFATLVAGHRRRDEPRAPADTFRAQEDAVGYFTTFDPDGGSPWPPGRRLLRPPRDLHRRERTGCRPLPSNWPGRAASPRSGRALDEASIGWIGGHAARRPRAGSNGCGARSRTGS